MTEEEQRREMEWAYIVIMFLIAALGVIGYGRYHDHYERESCIHRGGHVEELLDEHGRSTTDWTCRMEDRD